MKKHILVLALGLLTSISFGQTLSAGDIVVIGYDVDNTTSDTDGCGIYLLTLKDIPINGSFYITDNMWDGNEMEFVVDISNETKDGILKLTNTSNSTIPAGTRIDVRNIQSNNVSNVAIYLDDVSTSSISKSRPVSSNDKIKPQTASDVIYIYTGSTESPNFITAFTVKDFGSTTGDLPAGLGSAGFNLKDGNIIDFNAACAAYNMVIDEFANASEALTTIYNVLNWDAEPNESNINDSTDGGDVDLPASLAGVIVSLPIELINFEVSKYGENEALISWSTAMEIDNDYFQIERAGADLRFNTLETIDGAIESTEVISYEVIDEQPLDGVNYYRLKQVDLDGTTSYFDVRSVDFGSNQQGLVFPNPVKGKIFISGESYLGAQYNVIDLSGAVKMTGVVTKEQLELSAEGLEEGIYFLQLVSKGTTHTYKFSKI